MLNTRVIARAQAPRRRMRTPVRLPQPTERHVHLTVLKHVQRLGMPGLLTWHTPNGGSRNRVEAARLKQLGVVPGIADLLFLYRGRLYSLELKIAAGGRVSEAQLAWQANVNASGGFAAIALGLDEAIRILEQWKLLRGRVS